MVSTVDTSQSSVTEETELNSTTKTKSINNNSADNAESNEEKVRAEIEILLENYSEKLTFAFTGEDKFEEIAAQFEDIATQDHKDKKIADINWYRNINSSDLKLYDKLD